MKPPPVQPVITMQGEAVALGPPGPELVPQLQRWLNDFEVGRTTWGVLPLTLEDAEARYRQNTGSGNVSFVIYERATMRLIGTTLLTAIDHHNRTASFGLLIGEKDCWGKGYGTETTRLMLEYAFNALDMHNIMLTMQAYNRRALRAYEKAGFRVIGRRREAHRLGGRSYDEIFMECLATEFEGSVLLALRPDE
ncbi:MAG: GNAT family N-acetyltransferase [Chloroflexota bacterium]|nr:GNAT family N-acetyltransferase [Chloroflexota bacterium]